VAPRAAASLVLGALFGALACRGGAEVTLVARGAHAQAMIERGLAVERPGDERFTVRPRVVTDLSALVASEVAESFDFSAVRRVVDVGGAHGTVLATLLIRFPWLEGVVLDLPHVVPGARRALEAQGLAGRCRAVEGDFFAAVPPGGDVYLLKQILHDWDDAQCTAILRACARAMAPRGRVFVVEMVIPDDGAPGPAQLMDLNMLVLLPGRERTRAEYAALLSAAGLTLEGEIPNRSPFGVLVARG